MGFEIWDDVARSAWDAALSEMAAALEAKIRGEHRAGRYQNCSLRDFSKLAAMAKSRATDVGDYLSLNASSSDFLVLLTNASQKIFIDSFSAVETTFTRFSLQVSFKTLQVNATVSTSGFPPLAEIDEGGEVTLGALTASSEPMRPRMYGRIFGLPRQVFINDDAAAITASMTGAGESAKVNRNDVGWSLIRSGTSMNGPTCADGVQYFDAATHGNLLSGAALDQTSFAAAVAAMRNQKGLDGSTRLGIKPRFIVVGPTLEVPASKLLVDSGPQLGVELLVEPAITNADFYLFADPSLHASFILGTLNDEPPTLVSRVAWSTDAYEFRLTDTFGVSAGDWRAAVRTPAP